MPRPRIHHTFEAWQEDFPFSEDLQELEAALSIRSETLESTQTPSGAAPANLQAFTEAMTDRLLSRLPEELSPEELTEKLTRNRELQRDNRILAAQVEQLLGENEQMHQALAELQSHLSTFKPLFGHFYLKR